MIGKIKLKRAIKRAAGLASVMTSPFMTLPNHPRACILLYHRVAEIDFIDPYLDDWNVRPDVFEQHISALAEFAEVVPLLDLPDRMASPSSSKPLVCLTFDDGYANICTNALPILRRYAIPATAFVVTGFIGCKTPMPFDRWGRKNKEKVSSEAWRPMNWAELETCMASGLISIGSHSHKHLDGRTCTPAQLLEEARQSQDVLSNRVNGRSALAYAYPYGSTRIGNVSADYIKAVQASDYCLAVSTDMGLAHPDNNPYLLPRIEVTAVDTPAVLRAKVLGALYPYYFTDRLRKAKRTA